MPIVEQRHRGLFTALLATFVVFGVSCTVVGAALPTILADLKWSYGIAGALMGAGSLGSFLGIYAGGKLIDRIGPRTIMGVGFALCSGSLLLFGATPSPILNIALYLALGLGQACLEVSVNWMSLHMDSEGAGRPMNVMHGAFSIGAVTGPFAMGVILSSQLHWTVLYRGAALLNLALLALTFVLPLSRLPKLKAPEQGQAKSKPGAARYIGFLALLFYVGTELGVSNWSAEYFVRHFSWSAAAASFTVSIFWAGLAAGRFAIPLFWKRARPDRLLVLLSVLMALAIGALAALGSGGAAFSLLAVVATFVAGLGASCVYPSVITLVGRASGEDPGAAIGVSAAGGSFGSFVFPFLMSAIATAWGVQAGFIFYAAMGLVSLVACAALAASINRRLAPGT